MDGSDHSRESQAGGLVKKLSDGEAVRVAALLSRVVPRSPAEAVEIESYVKRLQGGRS